MKGYGTVNHGGHTYTLLQDAYLDSDSNGNPEYHAEAVDDAGNKYRVIWHPTHEWDLATEHANLEAMIRQAERDGDEVRDEDRELFAELDAMTLPDVEDEINACSWDAPYDVILTESA